MLSKVARLSRLPVALVPPSKASWPDCSGWRPPREQGTRAATGSQGFSLFLEILINPDPLTSTPVRSDRVGGLGRFMPMVSASKWLP